MALSNRKLIGTWKNVPGSVFQAITFDNGTTFYLAQVLKEYPLSFYIRGRGLAQNTNEFQLASGVTTDDLTQLVESDTYGVQKPSSFKTPAGYVEKYATDGTAFFVNAEEQRQADLGNDSDGDGVPDTRSANLFTQATDWVKANPVLAVGIAVAVYLFILKPMMGGGKGKKKGLLALL
ncbi:hypothetical protein [Emticicia soli]|uniref:Uncharacterized protein n=1 Tax=Emticicia soli TaxID=2027878 RepID=A0ABW5J6U2_9BACT